ncbi:hypothetical protein HDK90DRAFT_233550 [Phyllosticta capitalensis]|uniref:Secreted protein n=1 Tax=Phyllosticta capitalensis TaxID=121624 RepID=A0ABR1YNM8_9PEZI
MPGACNCPPAYTRTFLPCLGLLTIRSVTAVTLECSSSAPFSRDFVVSTPACGRLGGDTRTRVRREDKLCNRPPTAQQPRREEKFAKGGTQCIHCKAQVSLHVETDVNLKTHPACRYARHL